MSDALLDHFVSQWRFLRGLTNDLLDASTDAELLKSPDKTLGPWWKQFRHVGRVQENYLSALQSGSINFTTERCSYSGGSSRDSLKKYFERLDSELFAVLDRSRPREVDWFGEKKSLAQHLLCLADHEILHHGQWIVYKNQLSGAFPSSWSVWGL